MRVSAVELFMGYVLVFIACCGVPSCYHHGQDQLVGVVKGRGWGGGGGDKQCSKHFCKFCIDK